MKGLLFTYFLTYGGAIASLFNPFLGLLIYVCFAIMKPDALWFWAVPEGNYSRTVAVGLLIGWVLKGFGNWQFGRGRIVVVALVGFWGWTILSATQAPEATLAWNFVESLSKIVLPFLVGITTIDSARKLNQLIWVVLLSQGYVAYELNMTYFSGYNRLWLEGFATMDNNSVAIALVTCVGLAFFAGLAAEAWWGKVLAFGMMAFMIHAVLFSFSRGGMLALLFTGAAAFLLIPKRFMHYVALLLVVAGGLQLAGSEVQNRFMTIFARSGERDASAESRLDLWRACLDCMVKYPLTGVGPEQWGFIVTKYGFNQGKLAHTLWLQTGAELGLPGLLFLATFYFSCMFRLWPLARQRLEGLDPWLCHCARMVIASLIGFAVSAQFVSLSLLEVPFYITLIGAGVLKVQFIQNHSENPDSSLPLSWSTFSHPGELDMAEVEEQPEAFALDARVPSLMTS